LSPNNHASYDADAIREPHLQGVTVGDGTAIENSEKDTLIAGVQKFKAALEGMRANIGELDKYRTDAKVSKDLFCLPDSAISVLEGGGAGYTTWTFLLR
jgi:hypothetical protein